MSTEHVAAEPERHDSRGYRSRGRVVTVVLTADCWASCACEHFRINHPDNGPCWSSLGCDCQEFKQGPSLGLSPEGIADMLERRPQSAG